MFLFGVESGRANWGVGFAIKQELARFVLNVRFVNERIMWISVKLEGAFIVLLVYTAHAKAVIR